MLRDPGSRYGTDVLPSCCQCGRPARAERRLRQLSVSSKLEEQQVVDTTITALSRATGVSWRQTQACVIFRLPLLRNAGRLVTGRFAPTFSFSE